jgi:hypothetical protein
MQSTAHTTESVREGGLPHSSCWEDQGKNGEWELFLSDVPGERTFEHIEDFLNQEKEPAVSSGVASLAFADPSRPTPNQPTNAIPKNPLGPGKTRHSAIAHRCIG